MILTYLPAFCICIILIVFARQDVKTREIPFKWWGISVAPCLLGFFMATNPVCISISFLLWMTFFIMGFFRLLNGADALGCMAVILAFMPLSYGGTPISAICITAAFLFGSLIYLAVRKSGKGVPLLLPLAICASLTLLVYLLSAT